jgi:hypothetical protein
MLRCSHRQPCGALATSYTAGAQRGTACFAAPGRASLLQRQPLRPAAALRGSGGGSSSSSSGGGGGGSALDSPSWRPSSAATATASTLARTPSSKSKGGGRGGKGSSTDGSSDGSSLEWPAPRASTGALAAQEEAARQKEAELALSGDIKAWAMHSWQTDNEALPWQPSAAGASCVGGGGGVGWRMQPVRALRPCPHVLARAASAPHFSRGPRTPPTACWVMPAHERDHWWGTLGQVQK